MSRSSTSTPSSPDPTAIDASLHLLAHQISDDLAKGEMPPSLLHVALDTDGLQLGFKDLDGVHPSEFLLGFVAPESWYALGSATAGYAYDVADRATLAPRRRRVHTVTLVSRSGEVAHRTIVHGDPALTDGLAGEDVTGEQIDLLRLALELPTTPPPCDTAVFWAIEWLSAILADGGPSDWASVARAHPALAVLGSAGSAPDPDDIIDAATAFVRVCTWRRLRTLVAEGRFEVPELTPIDARWFDEGAFARFVLTRCPPLAMLRRQAIDQLPDEVGSRLAATLDDLGIPAASWPDEQAA